MSSPLDSSSQNKRDPKKAIFEPSAKCRAQKLAEKAKKLRRPILKEAKTLNDLCDQDDSKDFKDDVKPVIGRSKLKLRKETSTGETSTSSCGTIKTDDDCVVFICAENPTNLRAKSEVVAGTSSAGREIRSLHNEDLAASESRNVARPPGLSAKREDPGSNVPTKRCLVCHALVAVNSFEQHCVTCLRSNFSKTSGQHCVTCLRSNFSKTSGQHCVTCLRSNFSKTSAAAQVPDADRVQCKLCRRDLTLLSSQLQLDHMTKCAEKGTDDGAPEASELQEHLEAARDAVLPCPLCGQRFKSEKGRKGHLKRCASSKEMPVGRVRTVLEQQAEEYRDKLDNGLLPQDFFPPKQKKKKKGLASRAVPKSSLEEDTQLALALSNSLAESKEEEEADGMDLLERAGAESRLGNPRPKGKRGKQKETTNLLTSVLREEAQQRITDRIARYIFSVAVSEQKTPPFKKRRGQPSEGPGEENTPSLWSRAQAGEFASASLAGLAGDKSPSASSAEVTKAEEFYVRVLMPPMQVDVVRAGSKLKNLLNIPGRRRTIKALAEAEEEDDGDEDSVEDEESEEGDDNEEDEDSEEGDDEVDSVGFPVSQTAHILAQLAEEGMSDSSCLTQAVGEGPSSQTERQAVSSEGTLRSTPALAEMPSGRENSSPQQERVMSSASTPNESLPGECSVSLVNKIWVPEAAATVPNCDLSVGRAEPRNGRHSSPQLTCSVVNGEGSARLTDLQNKNSQLPRQTKPPADRRSSAPEAAVDCRNPLPVTPARAANCESMPQQSEKVPPGVDSSSLTDKSVPADHHKELLQAFASLVGSSSYSDISIATGDNQHLCAHKVVLFCRCPSLLRLIMSCNGRDEIDLTEWRPEVVSGLLRFIYSAQLPDDPSLREQVRSLGQRYDMQGLPSVDAVVKEEKEESRRKSEKVTEDVAVATSPEGGFMDTSDVLEYKDVFGGLKEEKEEEMETGSSDNVDGEANADVVRPLSPVISSGVRDSLLADTNTAGPDWQVSGSATLQGESGTSEFSRHTLEGCLELKESSLGSLTNVSDAGVPSGTPQIDSDAGVPSGTPQTDSDAGMPSGTLQTDSDAGMPSGTLQIDSDADVPSGTLQTDSDAPVPSGTLQIDSDAVTSEGALSQAGPSEVVLQGLKEEGENVLELKPPCTKVEKDASTKTPKGNAPKKLTKMSRRDLARCIKKICSGNGTGMKDDDIGRLVLKFESDMEKGVFIPNLLDGNDWGEDVVCTLVEKSVSDGGGASAGNSKPPGTIINSVYLQAASASAARSPLFKSPSKTPTKKQTVSPAAKTRNEQTEKKTDARSTAITPGKQAKKQTDFGPPSKDSSSPSLMASNLSASFELFSEDEDLTPDADKAMSLPNLQLCVSSSGQKEKDHFTHSLFEQTSGNTTPTVHSSTPKANKKDSIDKGYPEFGRPAISSVHSPDMQSKSGLVTGLQTPPSGAKTASFSPFKKKTVRGLARKSPVVLASSKSSVVDVMAPPSSTTSPSSLTVVDSPAKGLAKYGVLSPGRVPHGDGGDLFTSSRERSTTSLDESGVPLEKTPETTPAQSPGSRTPDRATDVREQQAGATSSATPSVPEPSTVMSPAVSAGSLAAHPITPATESVNTAGVRAVSHPHVPRREWEHARITLPPGHGSLETGRPCPLAALGERPSPFKSVTRPQKLVKKLFQDPFLSTSPSRSANQQLPSETTDCAAGSPLDLSLERFKSAFNIPKPQPVRDSAESSRQTIRPVVPPAVAVPDKKSSSSASNQAQDSPSTARFPAPKQNRNGDGCSDASPAGKVNIVFRVLTSPPVAPTSKPNAGTDRPEGGVASHKSTDTSVGPHRPLLSSIFPPRDRSRETPVGGALTSDTSLDSLPPPPTSSTSLPPPRTSSTSLPPLPTNSTSLPPPPTSSTSLPPPSTSLSPQGLTRPPLAHAVGNSALSRRPPLSGQEVDRCLLPLSQRLGRSTALTVGGNLTETLPGNDWTRQVPEVQVRRPEAELKSPEKKPAKKARMEPSPFTPMAPYGTMNTPELKLEAAKIGVRPVGKKRMRALLEHVYHQTHQYESDSDCESTPVKRPRNNPGPSSLSLDVRAEEPGPSAKTKGIKKTTDGSQAKSTDALGRSELKLSKGKEKTSAHLSAGGEASGVTSVLVSAGPRVPAVSGDQKVVGSVSGPTRSLASTTGSDAVVSDVVVNDVVSDDDGLAASQDSSCSDGPDMAEESILQGWPDEEEEGLTQCTQSSPEALEGRIHDIIVSNRELYEKVLMYEPLELEKVKQLIASAGLRIGMAKLMDYLDSHCVTFTMKNMSSRNNRQPQRAGVAKKPRKPKKTSAAA
ncbi:uncharacterized protein LOC101857018 isoform X3 [Aplysia californica]|uniref:Structure-specific endonuclease subunit SLX4 n=1 Tax=Aplysia californica TaxID=6500 RepID=A0ABM0ZXS2_APLCA|nr:uncharacterized protein LOC101857018 isoform X3 [Aplysia californica]